MFHGQPPSLWPYGQPQNHAINRHGVAAVGVPGDREILDTENQCPELWGWWVSGDAENVAGLGGLLEFMIEFI